MNKPTFMVTGALGCIGAWTVYHLLQRDVAVVSFDISDQGHRLDLLLNEKQQQAVDFVTGDLSDFKQVKQAIENHSVTHIVHLAALQVPFCRQDPVRGAQVNVTGTVNIFEAARQADIKHIGYASSIAVYGPPDSYPAGPIQHDAPFDPRTIYGVYKVANEGTARIYWQDHGLSSVGLRPHTVYGVGRDQGLTSDPTKAMLAAVKNEPFHINFGGRIQLHWASDVAQQFIAAAEQDSDGAHVYNLGGPTASIAEVVETIRRIRPDAAITFEDKALPFPNDFDDSALREGTDRVYDTPLDEGFRATMLAFEQLVESGQLE